MTSVYDILPELTGTNIDLTYQDGLRLSELAGAMAQAQYRLDHFWTANFEVYVVAALLGIVAFMAVIVTIPSRPSSPEGKLYLDACCRERDFERYDAELRDFNEVRRKRFILAVVLAVVTAIAVIPVAHIAIEAVIEGDMASYQAQIDAILGKYGVMA